MRSSFGLLLLLALKKEKLKYVIELKENNLPIGVKKKYLGRRQREDGPYFFPFVWKDG